MVQRSAARIRPASARVPYWMRASRGRSRSRLDIVSEEDASPAVRECFEEITATLGFPVVNVIFRAFARYPRFLALSWDLLKPNVLTQDLFDKTQVLRRQAQLVVRENLGVGDHRAVLRMRGSSDDALARIRTVLDFFLYGDPFLLLIASALQSSLSGHALPGKPWAHLLPMHTNPTRFQELKLVEMEEAPPAVQAIYSEITQAHGANFVPTDYRALGRWPECLSVVWEDWKQRIQTPAYEAGVRQLNELALALAQDLPFGFALSPQTLARAGFTPLQVSDILATVDFFQGLLPALIVNITAFRIGLEGGCRPAPSP
ncbi:MAG: halocarboxylic acid dehydrogenase DehI family protein [Candidatus Rokubacteria bacterium]|nr:halocarboxylic acid dehydrogenase DehI family protein [Candidatus Rokubacteria bacterium]